MLPMVNGACTPNSSGVSFEHLFRELASQITRQGEQFSLLANSMADTQRQLHDLTDASTLRLSGYVLTRNVPMVSTSLWRRYVYNWMPCSQPRFLPSKRKASCQTGPFQSLQDLRAPARTDGTLRAKPPARVRVVLLFPSQEEDKDFFFTSEDCTL